MMLASCSNDEVVEQAQENAISFRSMMGANTRGVVADVSNLNTLCVTAYQGTNLHFDNVIFQKDGTGFFKLCQALLLAGNRRIDFHGAFRQLERYP